MNSAYYLCRHDRQTVSKQAVNERFVQRGVFFVSRFYFRTAVFGRQGQPINLLALLRQKGKVDQWVCLGQKEKMPVRLVAFRAPARVANARRRKARAHVQNRCTLTHPLAAPPFRAEAAEVEGRYYRRLRVNWLPCQCLVSVVLEPWGVNVAEGLARQRHYHDRYEKRQRRNIVQKVLALA